LTLDDEYQDDLEADREPDEDPEYLADYGINPGQQRLQLKNQQLASRGLKLEKSGLNIKRDIFSHSPMREPAVNGQDSSTET
jgi:hypothetical protein